ncbi:MAG: hypothetical protein ACEQSH_00175 [Bacteroidia bacterium]
MRVLMPDEMILTSRGPMAASLLDYRAGTTEDGQAVAEWEEWRVIGDPTGEIVKRNASVRKK